MSRFLELGKVRLTILDAILHSQELCKSLFYDDTNFLEHPDIDDTSLLISKNIFPYNYLPDLKETKESYVTFTLRDYRPVGNKFKSGILHFQIIIHKDKVSTDYEMLRYDFVMQCLDSIFNEKRELGIGKLEFNRMDEFYVNENYVGFYLQYKMWEFN